jgi:hypothetical protein
MTIPDELWTTRLHAAVDDHPSALSFDVPTYLAAGRRRARRRRGAAVAATAAAVAVLAGVSTVSTRGGQPEPAPPVGPSIPILGPGVNGWVAVGSYEGDFVDDPYDGDVLYIARSGEAPRRLEVPGSDAANDACPAWSPDGTRLLFGRLTGPSEAESSDAELVIVPVSQNGVAGSPTVIELDGFEVLGGGGVDGVDPHPCGIWSPDGRWVAFAGTGEVWVVDTQTGAIRRLPDLRPSDLEWRPGTDELTIAGDVGTSRGSPTLLTPVTVYSVSTDEVRELGSVTAAHITWSPDGTTMAYTSGLREGEVGSLGQEGGPQLWLVDGDGDNERLLVADLGGWIHGIGPVWSPSGDRIVYQRLETPGVVSGERHVAVLVDVADGTAAVVDPPKAGGHIWYPFTVSWSPDGTTLLYAAWHNDDDTLPEGVIAVPADRPSDASVLIDSPVRPVPDYYSHRWTAVQMWGRDQ